MITAEGDPRQLRAVEQGVQHEHEDEQRLEPEAGAVGRVGAAEDDLRGQFVQVLLDALGDPAVDEELAERRVRIDLLDPFGHRLADDVDLLAELDRAERQQPATEAIDAMTTIVIAAQRGTRPIERVDRRRAAARRSRSPAARARARAGCDGSRSA